MVPFRKYMSKVSKCIFQLSSVVEGVISAIILLAIIMEIVTLVVEVRMFELPLSTVHMNEVLDSILWLVIGLEFIKMLIEHSHGAVLEVMLFAIARQMIISHDSMVDNLLGVAAIAGVFAIRKFLYDKREDPAHAELLDAGKQNLGTKTESVDEKA